jgi:GTPase SAR1 family protein
MPKVYLSATFEDLKDYRRLAAVTLKKMGYDDMAMEYYVAEDRTSVDRCLADIDACDLYVLLVAWRYGWIPPGADVSITETEYRRAVQGDKKRLVFVLDKSTPWPPDLIDDDKTKIKAFRQRVQDERLVAMFSSPDALAAALTNALYYAAEIGANAVDGLDVDAYYRYLRKRYAAADVDALLDPKRDELLRPQLQRIFVEQEVKQDRPPELPKELQVLAGRDLAADGLPPGITTDDFQRLQQAYVDKPSRPVLDVIAAPENRCVVILGDPGSGKSTLLRYLLLQATEPSSNARLEPLLIDRIPLLIDLRAYAAMRAKKDADTFLGYFDCLAKAEGCPATAPLIERLLKQKRSMLVLFDGIDEIFDKSEQETITRQIIAFAEAQPEARIAVSSRIIGYPRALLTDAGFAHFTLQDFGAEQVKSFVTQWYSLTLADSPTEVAQRIERMLKSFESSPSIRQLSGNPMLLTIMAIIGKHQELPRERWKLYDHAASVLVYHWDVKKHLAEAVSPDFMDEEDKKDLLRQLAIAMHEGKGGLRGNYIQAKELEAEFETYLKERYSLPPDRAVKIARRIIELFRTRNFILSFYGASLYGFVHRAFLEFFVASALVQRFEKTPDFGIEELRATFREHAAQSEWHEVLRLICGIVGEQYAAELIEQLHPQNGESRDHLPIAIACLGELRRLDTVAPLAERLLLDACNVVEDRLSSSSDASTVSARCERTIAAVRGVGNRWPRKERFRQWISGLRKKRVLFGFAFSRDFGEFVASVDGGSVETCNTLLSLLESKEYDVTSLVPDALARGWPADAITISTLVRLANGDDNWTALNALEALGLHLNDQTSVRDLIFQCAQSLGSSYRRWGAYIAIGSMPIEPRTKPALVYAVLNESQEYPRSQAIRALGRHVNDPDIWELLLQLLYNDESTRCRESVVSQLALDGVEKAVPVLEECAEKNDRSEIREYAAEKLRELHAR